MDKSIIHKTYNILFLSFVFLIPFEDYFNAVPNILLGTSLFLGLFLISKDQLTSLLINKTVVAFLSLILFVFLTSVLRGSFNQDFFFLSKIIIPPIVLILSLPVKNLKLIKQVFIISVLTAILLSCYNLLEFIIENKEFEFKKGKFINEILVSERIYIGFCAALALIFNLDILSKIKKKSIKVFLTIASVVFISFIFLIVARVAMLAILLTLVIYFFTKFSVKKGIYFTLIFLVFAAAFTYYNGNITNRFIHNKDKYRKGLVEKVKNHEPRIIIWKCSYNILSTNSELIYGNGFGKIKNQLAECYESTIEVERKRKWFVESKFNTHNQFIDFLLSAGIISLLLFLAFLFYLYRESKKDFFAVATLGSVILILLVDNIIHRQIGGYLLGLVMILLLNNNNKKVKN